MARRPRTVVTRIDDDRPPVEWVIYLRLSDLHQRDVNEKGTEKTFADRETALRKLAARLGGTVVRVVTENDVLSKNGRQGNASAFKRRKVTLADGSVAMRVVRPGFSSVLADLREGRATGLLAENLDRAMRDPYDLEALIDLVREKRLNVRSLSGSLTFTDGGTNSELTTARVMLAVAQQSSLDTQWRVTQGRARKAYNGEYGGGPRPYGFDSDGVTKRPDECLIIAKMSRRVLQLDGRKNRAGKLTSLRLMADELRAAGVPTVTGTAWTASTLRDILLRPRNAGIMVYQGEEIGSAPWAPIVPVDVFRAVVRVLTDPSRRTNAERGAAPRWLGAGIYLCGICNDGTTCWVTGGKDRPKRYACKKTNHLVRNAEHLDAFVAATIVDRLSRPDAASLFTAVSVADVDPVALRTEALAVRENLNELAADKAAGLIDREQLITGSARGRARLETITELLSSAVVDSVALPLLDAEDIAAAWEEQPLAVKRAVLLATCTVTVNGGARRRPGFDPTAVTITPRGGPTPKLPRTIEPAEQDETEVSPLAA